MYLVSHESKESNKRYTIIYPVAHAKFAMPYIENELHERINFSDKELFDCLDKFFEHLKKREGKD